MLPLKHLIYNHDLSKNLVKHWRCNPLQEKFLEGFRISSNVITWYRYDGQLYFLRYTPAEATTEAKLSEELAYLNHLNAQGYTAAVPVLTLGHKPFMEETTPWGTYFATVFEGASGHSLEAEDPSEALAYAWGEKLGALHDHSKTYAPQQALTYVDKLNWVKTVLTNAQKQGNADPRVAAGLREADALLSALHDIPQTRDSYGFIHYDFELDNIVYDPDTKLMTVVDFDDAHLHFFGQDIERALNSLRNEWHGDSPETNEALEAAFLRGYGSQNPLPLDEASTRYLFTRYGNLLGFARILHALSDLPSPEVIASEEWLPGLIGHLNDLLDSRSKTFC